MPIFILFQWIVPIGGLNQYLLHVSKRFIRKSIQLVNGQRKFPCTTTSWRHSAILLNLTLYKRLNSIACGSSHRPLNSVKDNLVNRKRLLQNTRKSGKKYEINCMELIIDIAMPRSIADALHSPWCCPPNDMKLLMRGSGHLCATARLTSINKCIPFSFGHLIFSGQWVNLQKLCSLWEADCIVAVFKFWVSCDHATCHFNLFVWMHEISTVEIFNFIISDSNRFYVRIWAKHLFQKCFKRTQAEWKTTRIAWQTTNRNMRFSRKNITERKQLIVIIHLPIPWYITIGRGWLAFAPKLKPIRTLQSSKEPNRTLNIFAFVFTHLRLSREFKVKSTECTASEWLNVRIDNCQFIQKRRTTKRSQTQAHPYVLHRMRVRVYDCHLDTCHKCHAINWLV